MPNRLEHRLNQVQVQVEELRTIQLEDGSIALHDKQKAVSLLRNIRDSSVLIYDSFSQKEMSAALEADLFEWHARGLGTPPFFDRTLKAFTTAGNNRPSFFIGPVCAVNSQQESTCFEAFAYQINTPLAVRKLSRDFPHQANQCDLVKVLHGTTGIADGNCIVFFPENILTSKPVKNQHFGLFLMNKFFSIFHEQTLPATRKQLVGWPIDGNGMFLSATLDEDHCYEARCVWAHLHEYFHNIGAMPLVGNLETKILPYPGVLEELKVDCQVILEAMDGIVPWAKELIEMVFFDRLFRYPLHPNASSNIDAATGFLLRAWLIQTDAACLATRNKC